MTMEGGKARLLPNSMKNKFLRKGSMLRLLPVGANEPEYNPPLDWMTERKLMENADVEQRSFGDKFWGIDKEFNAAVADRERMSAEDKFSARCQEDVRSNAKKKVWETEYGDFLDQKALQEGFYEMKKRVRYLKTFYAAATSATVMSYNWLAPGTNGSTGVGGFLDQEFDEMLILPTSERTEKAGFHATSLQQAHTLHREETYNDNVAPNYDDVLNRGGIGSTLRGLEAKNLALQQETGHPSFKWDQEVMLRQTFALLDKTRRGFLMPVDLAHVADSHIVQSLLKHTALGTLVKRRQWKELLQLLFSSEYNNASHISLGGFLNLVKHKSTERGRKLRSIRTREEYNEVLYVSFRYSPEEQFAINERRERSSHLRDAQVAQEMFNGEVVWAMADRDCMWRPAIVEECGNALNNFSYTVRFPFTQDELREATKLADATKVLRSGARAAELVTHEARDARMNLQAMALLTSQASLATDVATNGAEKFVLEQMAMRIAYEEDGQSSEALSLIASRNLALHAKLMGKPPSERFIRPSPAVPEQLEVQAMPELTPLPVVLPGSTKGGRVNPEFVQPTLQRAAKSAPDQVSESTSVPKPEATSIPVSEPVTTTPVPESAPAPAPAPALAPTPAPTQPPVEDLAPVPTPVPEPAPVPAPAPSSMAESLVIDEEKSEHFNAEMSMSQMALSKDITNMHPSIDSSGGYGEESFFSVGHDSGEVF